MNTNPKLEKYYDYIVKDVLNNTKHEINNNTITINFPWDTYTLSKGDIIYSYNTVGDMRLEGISELVVNHLSGRYGMKNDEIALILKKLLTTIYPIILNDLKNV